MDKPELRYRQLHDWDASMMALNKRFEILQSAHQLVSHAGTEQRPPQQVKLASYVLGRMACKYADRLPDSSAQHIVTGRMT